MQYPFAEENSLHLRKSYKSSKDHNVGEHAGHAARYMMAGVLFSVAEQEPN